MPVLLYLLALAVFAQGTSEFVLAGLLPALATDLGVPLGQAGGLTSAYALGMVVGAPVMAALARRLSPRWALTAFLLLFVLAHVVGAVTDAFAVLLTTRVVAAVANAGFLAVALSTVAAVVPAERRARGLAVVLAGVTLALVAGAPAGALLGGQLGWRATMWAIAAVSAPALVAVAVGTPTRPAGDGAPPARALDELAVLRRPRLQVTLALAVLVNSATFGTLTFLAVLATSRAGLPEALTPGLLAAFGVGAFGGVTAAGRLGDRYGRTAVGLGTPLLVVGWLAMVPGSTDGVAIWLLTALLGALSFGVGSVLIARVMAQADGAATLGGSFATAALNVGAVAGPLLCGLALERAGAGAVPLTSAVASALAALVWWLSARSGARAEQVAG
ncbi:MAG TPA: Cmx/CmrA family chloramphenicol efflux MFS transporter [Actinotalea caeni]|uniref:Cmx/CmrA family chloramphenicol efflux MFS transporter n=1 Tax=Actinotalea caeni TaxID=1348467 RepID=UPI002B4AB22A|nr:Cmx/CmrA family chloramphenicol efflux MFS transporter [Actinotalea caeni]HLV54169.1 Cmx/CmrA family chloramphenicol efflux MFS transporter [Actinotalea caeni]